MRCHGWVSWPVVMGVDFGGFGWWILLVGGQNYVWVGWLVERSKLGMGAERLNIDLMEITI